MQGMPVSLPESFSQNPQGADIGLWPLAWGWWALLFITLSILVWAGIWAVKSRRQRKARKQAIAAIKALPADTHNKLQICNQILKRVFMSYFPKGQVEKLHSQQWTQFLEAQLKPAKKAQFQPLFQALNTGLYQKSPELQEDVSREQNQQFDAFCIDYIKQALPPGKKQLQVVEGNSND